MASLGPTPPRDAALAAGAVLSHYRIVSPLGAGGMGVVYRAVDTRLDRPVALKVIAPALDDGGQSRRRFLKEARAASAFTHPNIVTIHEVDAAGGVDFIVMELVDGRSLEQRLQAGGLPIDDVLAIAQQMAAALESAHAAGIVHRDVKPANVMVTTSGHVKVLDFGVAKRVETAEPDAATAPGATATRAGTVLGSLAYMSPEQSQGLAVDGRSDVFSFGVVLYEMLAGRRPFTGSTPVEVTARILEGSPPPLEAARPDVPPALAALVAACLAKDRARRPLAGEVRARLSEIQQTRSAPTPTIQAVLARRGVRWTLVAGLAGLTIAAGTWWWAGRGVREARRQLPAIFEAADRYDLDGFYRAARSVVPLLPDEPRLQQQWVNLTTVASFRSEPPGADVAVKGYGADAPYISIGQTPLAQVRVPFGAVKLQVQKAGFAAIEGTLSAFDLNFTLDPVAEVPAGMVRVPGAPAQLEGRTVVLPDFWLDRYEVTNRQFEAFVDAGGYENQEYWKEPFVDGRRSLSWSEAMARLRDKTGRPGPADWELGTYPAGQDDYPVSGVSWYEAAAYAAFRGESLPTAYQWRAAAGLVGFGGNFSDILPASNFGQTGPAPVGSHRGLAASGTYDLAGNVKEWCWNESDGMRMILGGGWNEPTYMFEDRDAQPPLRRLSTYGFRLARNISPPPPAALEPVRRRGASTRSPASDDQFAILAGLYRYDSRPLDARVEQVDDAPDWRRETVSFAAAYGDERVTAYVFLPKVSAPPYQPVVHFPGGDAQLLRSSRDLRLLNVDYVIRSGRALVFPIYQGTYERTVVVQGLNGYRDVTIARVKDVARTLEYIDGRSDLDADRVGFHGQSLGAYNGVLSTAQRSRFKASVLIGAGLTDFGSPPEISLVNFAPRVTVPTLLISGRDDFSYPAESQVALFDLLGPPPDQKRHVVLEGGHIPLRMHEVIREVLDWYDRYLGPVPRRPGGAAGSQ